ncbi:thymidylate synthase [Pseudooceanicola sp.]|uniref:thymidylate synthase n=1 Tax=Pseudooceanicola sp. TaxID=1914328 RepID=UPI0026346A5C|nr:thymidylate synthase [Pseudooceanicola sp.]MDF1853991.1 thymidylate synthase [Pseudooceanicola sp.]
MFRKATFSVAALVVMAACSGSGTNPFTAETTTDTTTDTTTTTTIPSGVAGDLSSITYDATAQTLVVSGITLDDKPVEGTYVRQAALDAQFGGYQVFTSQDDSLDRHAIALVLQSQGTAQTGQVRAGVAATGGPRNRYFAGGYYERDGDYDPPDVSATSGLVSYAGSYVGLTNIGVRDGLLIAVDPTVPIELQPYRAAQVTGNVFLNADFGDNSVEGNIYNRTIVPTGQNLPSLVLVASSIATDGTFSGEVEYDSFQTDPTYAGLDPTTDNDIGDYAGIFGGTDSASVGGLVHLTELDGPDDRLTYEGEEEYGVFVLQQCGTTGANSTLCNSVN